MAGADSPAHTDNSHVKACRKCINGACEIIRDVQRIEKCGQPGVKNTVEYEDVDIHGENYIKSVNLATRQKII